MSDLKISIPDDVRHALEDLSKKTHRPVEEVACALIEKALYLERFRLLRQELRPYAKAAGFHTDDDVFKAVS